MDNLKNLVPDEVPNLLTISIVIVFVVIFCLLLWSRRNLYIAYFRLPGPLALSLFGNSGLNTTTEVIQIKPTPDTSTQKNMDAEQFKQFATATAEYIANYVENSRERPVLPNVQPGYLRALLPDSAPIKGESWQNILDDMDKVIMPGVTQWHSPNFHAYFPAGNSYPSMVGELMAAGFNFIGFNWAASPVCTELEVNMMDWLAKMLGLPEEFLNCTEGPGGGVLQSTASESAVVALLAAKEKTVKNYQKLHPEMDEQTIKSKLVAYTSDQSNSSVEKAGLLGSIPMRLLPTDEKCALRGATLKAAIEEDCKAGLIPCYVVATLGTTGTCAFDNLEELGPLCNEANIWLHIDAAYAGAAFVCPEYRHLMNGIQYVDSFVFNPHKWMLTNFDCAAMWVKNSRDLVEAFVVDRIYLQHQYEGSAVPDYRHWQISLGRKFRSLKLWFVLRCYGVEGIQKYIRSHVHQAQHFEQLMRADDRFEVTSSSMGLVCFRIKGDDCRTQALLDRLNERKNIYMIPAKFHGKLILRFVVCSRLSETKDIDFAWKEISTVTDEIIAEVHNEMELLKQTLGEKVDMHFREHITEYMTEDCKISSKNIL